MFKKLNTKTLVIILAVLIAIVAIVKLSESRKGERTFKSKLAEFETEEVTAISIMTKGESDQKLSLYKEGEAWKVEKEGKIYNADKNKVDNLLNTLLMLKPERVAGTIQEKWEAFEVTDSMSVRVAVIKENKELTDIHIGKFSYQNPTDPRQRQGKMTSYVRLANDDITYAVDGFLRMTFNSDINRYRNNSLINTGSSEWTSLTFTYPADSSFTLSKQNDKWMVNGLLADSVKVTNYLNSVGYLSSSNFVEDSQVAPGTPTHQLKIEGNNMVAPIEISAVLKLDNSGYILSSSLNSGTYFDGSQVNLFTKVFKGEDNFFGE